MILPPGITGYAAKGHIAPLRIEGGTLHKVAKNICSRERKAKIPFHKPYPLESNFSAVPIKIDKIITSLICNDYYPFISAVEGSLAFSEAILEFIPFPFKFNHDPKIIDFHIDSWIILSEQELTLKPDKKSLSHLYPEEISVIEHYQPTSISDIIYNQWTY